MAQVVPDDDLPGFRPVPLNDLPGASPASEKKRDRGLIEDVKDVGTALVEGVPSLGRRLKAAGQAAIGDLTGVEATAKAEREAAANSQVGALATFKEDLARRRQGADGSWSQAAKDVGGALAENPAAAPQLIAEQAPNALVSIGGAAAGAKAGALVAPFLGPAAPLAPIAGALLGLWLGNTAVETGGKAIEKASGGFTPAERGETLREGAVKGAVITGVDAITFGATKLLYSPVGKAMEKAGTEALVRSGVDVTTRESVEAALKDTAIRESVEAAQIAALKQANAGGRGVGRGAGAFGLQTAGEGAGEGLGEYAATGQVDPADVLLESLAGAGQSAAEIAIAKSGRGVKGLIDVARQRDVVDPDAQLDRALDRVEQARNEVYLGTSDGRETIANVLSAPDLSTAIDAAEASVPSMDELLQQKREAGAAAARAAMGETAAAPVADLEQAAAAAQQRSQAAIASVQAELGMGPVSALTKTPEQLAAAQTQAREELAGPARAPVAEQPGQTLDVGPIRDALRDRQLVSQLAPEERQQLLQAASSLGNTSLPVETRTQLARDAYEIIGRYQAGNQDTSALGNTARSGAAVLNGVPATNVFADSRQPAAEQPPLQFEATDIEPTTSLGAAPENTVEGIEPTGLVRALDEEAPIGARTGTGLNRTEIPAVPGTPGVPDVIQVSSPALADQAGGTEQQNQTVAGEPRDLGTELAKQRAAAGYDAKLAAAPRPKSVGGKPVEGLTNEQLQQIANDQKLPAIVRRGASIEIAHRAAELPTSVAAAATNSGASAAPNPVPSTDVATTSPTQSSVATDAGDPGWALQKYGTPYGSTREAAALYGRNDLQGQLDQLQANPQLLPNPVDRAEEQARLTSQIASIDAALPALRAQDASDQSTGAQRTMLSGAKQELDAAVAAGLITPEQAANAVEQARATGNTAAALGVLDRATDRGGLLASEQRAAPEATTVAPEATQQGKPVSSLGNWKPVDPGTLSTQSQTQTGTMSRQTHRMVSLLASMFGKRVVVFESDNDMAPDGFVRRGDSKTIYLNRKSEISHLVVFGHELLHQLKADNPQAYAALVKVIKLKTGANLDVAGIRGDMEELTADVVGNRFREVEFWQDVFREILASGTDARVSQRSAMRLGASVVRAVDRMVKALKGMTGFDTDNMVENLGEVKSAVTKALAGYAQEKRGEAAELIRQEVAGQVQAAPAATGEVVTSDRRGRLDNVEAFHYSQAPRKTLSSAMFGTGLRGSGREEYLNATDQRRRQRISFYFDKGTGVRPEAGVGGVPHRATLNNIYDSNADPLGLRKGGQAAFESAVLDAGFDGYLDRMEGTQPGQIILLGQRSVPVQALPPGPVRSGMTVEPLEEKAPEWTTQASGPTREGLEQRMARMQGQPQWADYDMQVVESGRGFFALQTRPRDGIKMSAARRGGTVEEIGEFKVRTQKDGTLGVAGEPDAIRALLPDGVRGRAVPGGMVFTTSDAPRVRAALEGRKLAYSRAGQVLDKLPMKDGKYIGAPEKYNTPAKIATLRKSLRNLAKEGEAGRYWYENSSREVLAMVGGNVQEARKFVALLAIYSPQAKVDANSTFALRAWAQYRAGQPISVKTGVMDRKAQAAMDDVDAFWSGEKTGNFFFNLLREIDPSTAGKQGATIDMWMMRAGEYSNDAPTATQYAFMENETNRLAQELGWEPQQVQAAIWVAMKARMENPGVKKRTEASSEKKGWIRYDYPIKNGRPTKTRVILNAQAHRDNWLKHAFQHDPTKSDTQGAKFDFSDGLRRHIGQLSWEARPGRTTGVLPGVNDAPYEQQVEFQQAMQKALLDDNGVDLLAYKLGLLVDGPDILAPGVWQGEIAAGMQKQIGMAPAKGAAGKSNIDPAQKKAIETYASMLGLLLRQEGVGYHRPFYKGKKSDENAVNLSVGRTFTPAEAQALWGAIDERMRAAGVADWENGAGLISSPDGMRVVNFGAIPDNLTFRKMVANAAETLPFDEVELQSFSTDGDLVTNDWKANPNGEGYRSRISEAYGPDLLEWAGTVLAPRVQSVFNEFSSKYGWGNAGDVAALFPAGQTAEVSDPSVVASEKRTFLLVHGGSDFEAIDKRMLGRGEPGGLRPLGNGFYGYLIRDSKDVPMAVRMARKYTAYAPTENTAIHAFKLELEPGEVYFKGRVWDEGLLSDVDRQVRDGYRAANALPAGPERKAAYDALEEKYPDTGERATNNRRTLTTEVLFDGELIEAATGEPSRLSRLGKWPADMSDSQIADALVGSFFDGDGDIVASEKRQTDTPEFRRWFGDSKVVDENGAPLVVYHATREDFSVFDDGMTADGAFHFGTVKAAEDAVFDNPDYEEDIDRPSVMPVYLSIKKPMRVKDQADNWAAAIARAKRLGHDGIVYRNEFEDKGSDSYIAFRPEQIKSATGNSGAFDPANPDITASEKRNIFGQKVQASWSVAPDNKLDSLLIYKLQDKQVDLKRVIEAVKSAVGGISDKWNAYLQEELYHGRTAKQTKDFLQDELRPLLQSLDANRVTIGEFEEYLHNRHAEERNRQIAKINPAFPDGGSGIDTADARAYLAGLDPAKRRVYESMAKRVDAIGKKTRDMMVASGLETKDTIDTWERTYGNYVPLFREDADYGAPGSMSSGQGFSVRGPASRRATGSDRPVVDILANLAMQRERTIVRAEKARVGTSLYGLAVQNPNPDFWLAIDPDAIKDVPGTMAQLVSMGMNPLDVQNIMQEPKQTYVDPRTGLVTQRVNPALRSNDNVLAVRINGQDKFVFFNTRDDRASRMVGALKNLDAQQLGMVMSMSAAVSRWFASVNTQYNPVFGAINLIRDTGGATFNLTTTPIADRKAQVMAGIMPAIRGIYSDLRSRRAGKGPNQGVWAQLWEEFQNEGGQTGFRDMFNRAEDRAQALQSEINLINEGKLKQAGRGIFNWLSDYNETLENAVRLSAYKAGKDKGLSNQQAASIAKNLTVNFNRKGEIGVQAGALYAFFNASVQGTARLVETLRGPAGKKIIAGGMLLGVMQALALAAAGFDEDEPPDFVKERNLVLPLDWVNNLGGPDLDGKYITIPMPLGLNVLPNTSRVLTEYVMSGFRDPAKRVAQITGSFLEMFNPIGNAGWSVQTIAPTFADPLVALAENRDWTGKPIAKEDRSGTDPTPGYTRAKDTASVLSKGLSYILNAATGGTDYKQGLISPTPDQIDYLIGQITGGVGREVLKVSQAVESSVTGEELPSNKVPILGRFYGDTKEQSGVASKFYANITKLNEHENEIKGRIKDRKPLGDYLVDNPEARLYVMGNAAERQVSELRRQKRDMIERGASKESIKLIEERITRRMKMLNDRLEALEAR